MPIMNRVRAATAASLLAATVLAAPIAVGATEEPEPGDREIPERYERQCLRVPLMTDRVEDVIERINGDAETKGSLLWLDQRIADAEENGRESLAEVRRNRRQVRELAIPVFEARLEVLASIDELCAEYGVGE